MGREKVVSYLNGRLSGGVGRILFAFLPRVALLLNAAEVMHQQRVIPKVTKKNVISRETIRIEPYNGENRHVQEMGQYLEHYLSEDICCAMINGSIANHEEVAYSDFDALVVLKDEVFEKRSRLVNTAMKLYKALSIMYDYDELQHHGWFIIFEHELNNYPEWYFPVLILKHSKCIYPTSGIHLHITCINANQNMKKTFHSLSDSIINQVMDARPKNMFALKRLLSQFMLLPALYLEAENERGVLKKESFTIAREKFDRDRWKIMDTVSEIRMKWDFYNIRKWWFLRLLPAEIRRFLIRRGLYKIPEELRKTLSDAFYQQMAALVIEMKGRLS